MTIALYYTSDQDILIESVILLLKLLGVVNLDTLDLIFPISKICVFSSPRSCLYLKLTLLQVIDTPCDKLFDDSGGVVMCVNKHTISTSA